MIFDIITLFPSIINSYCSSSITLRGIDKGIIKVNAHNLRDYSTDKHKKVDDTPYGGGGGMVLSCQPVFDCFESIKKEDDYEFIMLSPQGERYNQKTAVELSKKKQLILLCGHYEGFDERIRIGLSPREISIGDYVLTGGELPAMVLVDSVSRYVDGVLAQDSRLEESFSNGLLEYPQYTRPEIFEGMEVPEVLKSGHHKNIDKWRREQSLRVTFEKRPELLEKVDLTEDEQKFIKSLNKDFKKKEEI